MIPLDLSITEKSKLGVTNQCPIMRIHKRKLQRQKEKSKRGDEKRERKNRGREKRRKGVFLHDAGSVGQ